MSATWRNINANLNLSILTIKTRKREFVQRDQDFPLNVFYYLLLLLKNKH